MAALLPVGGWRPRLRRRVLIRRVVLCLALAGWLAPTDAGLPTTAAAGATRYVAPTGSDSGDCSASVTPCKTIGYAITQAHDGDTISIAAGTYAEHLDIEKNLTLVGAGQSITVIDGSCSGPVVTIGTTNTEAVVTLSGVTIQRGSGQYAGGIDNGGTLTLTNSTVRDNSAAGYPADGGGIHNDGTLTLTNSVIINNTADYGGGGIDNRAESTLTLTNSTVSGNSASSGGGIANTGAVTLTNSTLSGNTATGTGGGIFNLIGTYGGSMVLINSTVSGNRATGTGGGIYNAIYNGTSYPITLTNTILAGNTSPSGPDCQGSLSSGGYNLLGSAGGCSGLSPGVNGDQVGVDPRLGPLQDNGGPTLTMAPQPGSPALDAVPTSNCTLATDQRGQPRPDEAADSGACDIGAVEGAVVYQAPPPTSTPTTRATNTPTATRTGASLAPPATVKPGHLFDRTTSVRVGKDPTSVLLADLTRHGTLDLITANADNTVSVLHGDGHGRFGAAASYPVGAHPQSVAVGDLNGDGTPDLVTANLSGTVSMLLNDAHGRFRAGPSYRIGKSPASVAVSDLNGDRRPDLIVADGMDRLVSVLLGAGHGRFRAAISYRLGPPPHRSNWFVPRVHVAIAIGDVNGDGKPDLVTATADTFQSRSSGVARVSRSVGVMRVLLGDGHGRFRAIAPYHMVDMYPAAVVLADLNGDDRFEAIVAAEPTAPHGLSGICVLREHGHAGFRRPTCYPGGSASIRVADVNKDRKPDVVTTGGRVVSVLLNNGRGGFSPAASYQVGDAPGSQAIGDIDGDGTPDIVTANAATNTVSVALGNGRGGFRAPLVYAVNSDGTPIRLAVGDLDGDGRADLVTINYSGGYITNSVSVLLDDEHGGFRRAAGYHVGRGPILGGAIGALTASGRSDIVALDTNNGDIEILLNDGRGHFHLGTSPLGFPLGGGGSRPVDAAIGDLTGDGKADIAVIFPAFDYSTVGVFPGDGHGGAGVRTTTQCGVPPQKRNKVGPLAYALAIGDVDGDGTPDIVTANASGSVSVLRGDGHGSFGTAVSYPVGIGAAAVTLGDFNGDGTLDIVTANAGSSGPVLGEVPSGVTPGHTVSVLLNDGHGHFSPAVAYPVGVGPRSVAVGDVNGDGKPDIITANLGRIPADFGGAPSGHTVSVLLNDGHGRFGPAVAYPVGVGPRSVAVGDVNGDGKPDIVTANATADYSGESVTVLLNRS